MYPYKAGERVMLGISTWQHAIDPMPMDEYLAMTPERSRNHRICTVDGPICRYFKPATVIANDREAGVMVIKTDQPHAGGHGYDELHSDWVGDEVVPYDEWLPQTPQHAHRLALLGNHPDLRQEVA